MQLRTVCDPITISTHNIGSFEAKISIDIQQTFFFFVTMLASLRTKFLLPTFYVFFRVISKKRKKSCFLKSEKRKIVFSNTELRRNEYSYCNSVPRKWPSRMCLAIQSFLRPDTTHRRPFHWGRQRLLLSCRRESEFGK